MICSATWQQCGSYKMPLYVATSCKTVAARETSQTERLSPAKARWKIPVPDGEVCERAAHSVVKPYCCIASATI